MNCPKCKAAMETVAYEGIEVERCTQCKGLWFDALEAEHLKKLKGSESIDTGDPSKQSAVAKPGLILCPVCDTPMIQMTDIDHPDVHFESCTVCYGMFFDAGEFRHSKESHIMGFFKRLIGK